MKLSGKYSTMNTYIYTHTHTRRFYAALTRTQCRQSFILENNSALMKNFKQAFTIFIIILCK